MKKPGAFIGALATATPPYHITQADADAFLTKQFSDKLTPRFRAVMHSIFSHPAIEGRHFAIDSPEAFVREDPDSRIARFTNKAVELSSEAAMKALAKSGISAQAVSAVVVNTCTGYICPGLSTYLIERMGLAGNVNAYDLVGSGCGGAVPNLKVAGSQLTGNDDRVVLSVSVEICSATFQMENDLSAIISNALFSDGAAAAVIWGRPEGLELVASASRYFPEHREHIRYVHKNGQLYNQLSTSLPHLVKKAVADVVSDLLEPRSLAAEDIRHWALHTGGDKIINEIKSELGLSETQLRATRDILLRYGNMSSPTVWYVLSELIDSGIKKGDWCIMVAFGAGMSAHAYLLRQR